MLRRETNKLNHSTAYEYAPRFVGGEVVPERIAEGRGIDGTQPYFTALEFRHHSYEYDANNHQQPKDDSRVSLVKVVPGTSIHTTVRRLYEAGMSRLAGVITHGWTRDYQGNELEKYYATFYKTARGCTNASTDPFKRTLRVEGPCDVTSAGYNATSCTGTFPVTEFEYYDLSSGNGLKAGRLSKAMQYPDGSSCGTALVTEYTDYKASGMPTKILDPNGIETRFEYEDRRITKPSVTVGGVFADTLYAYEGDRLTQITYPKGNMERFCYRFGSNDLCTTGTTTAVLQWKAKFTSDGLTWTERIDYAVDGSLTHYRNPTEIRSTQTRYVDANSRPTSEGAGYTDVCNATHLCGLGPTLSTKCRFDGADNMTRLGLPFNQALDFCASDSTLCSWMTYDRAERLAGVDMHPDSSSSPTANSARICFEYDDHGNVKRAAAGCSGATGAAACPINKSGALQSSCAAYATDYEHDDFGNAIAVTFPWTSEAARAVTRYEYDPSGNLVRKQTAEIA